MTTPSTTRSLNLRSDSKPIEFIQALRGIAALLVVMWHGSRFISPYGTGLGFTLFGSGRTMGVDLFFLISGFIMVHTTTRNDGSAQYCGSYFVKRLTRIWPPYVALSLIYVLLSTGFGYFSSWENIRKFVETLTFVPSKNVSGAPVFDFPSLAVGWTLNFEMYFYLIFGLSLLFGRFRWYAFFSWIAITLIVLPLTRGYLTLGTATNYGYGIVYMNLVTSPMVWLFVTGAIIGLIYQSRLAINNIFYARLAVFVAISLVVWQYASGLLTEHGVLECGLSLIPFLLVLTLASKTIEIRVPRAAVYLGDISFSLYLIHPLVQERMVAIFNAQGLNSYASGPAFLFLTTMLAIAVAGISYRYVERGLSEWLNIRLRRAIRARSPNVSAGSISTTSLGNPPAG